MVHRHQLGDPCNEGCENRPEVTRRKPWIDMRFREGLAFLSERKYTGPFTVHAAEGVPKRIVIPNPEGW